MQDLVTDDALVAQGHNGAALGLEHITHHPLIARAAGVEIVGFVVELAGAHGELAFAEADMAMREQTTALVTGANKGIGTRSQPGLGNLGWSVCVGARDEGRREAAVTKLRAAGADAFGVPLNVTSDASVAAG